MKKVIIGAAAAAATLLATAVPAHAVTVVQSQEQRSASFATFDCAPALAIGGHCRAFEIAALYQRNFAGTVLKQFAVDVYDLQKTGPGSFTPTHVSDGFLVGSGNFTSGSGKTASLSFTITIICDTGGCGVEGSYKFNITLGKTGASVYDKQTQTEELEFGTCNVKGTLVESEIDFIKATGSVKSNGSTKTLRAVTAISSDKLEVQTLKLVTKNPQPGCEL